MQRNDYINIRSSQEQKDLNKYSNGNNNFINSNMLNNNFIITNRGSSFQQTPSLPPTSRQSNISQQQRLSSQRVSQNQQKKKTNKLFAASLAILYIKKIKKSIKKRKHRDKILQQWFLTQSSYNLDLNIAINQIKKPMQQSKIINRDQIMIMFPQFEGMIQLSNMMLQSIAKARKTANPNQIMLGKQLHKFVNGYKIYGGYFGSHSKSSKLLSQLAQTHQNQMKTIQSNIQAQLAKKQSKKEIMTIKDCMEQPLYRLFKYVLLLKQYIKKLPKYHPDFQSINICHNAFHDINNFNNDLMKKIQDQEKKVKLDKFFGEYLRENRILVAEMQASTIYFDAKLYIFQDIIIITKIQTILGSQREQKYANFILNQFSYVAEQQDLKYFKNILILIAKQQCIHFFFPDQGSRAELFKCMQKIFRELRIREYQKRKLGDPNKNTKAKKITFTLQQEQKNMGFLLQPEFRIEILGIEVRPLSTLSNDTAYITRFMIPYYYQDQFNFLQAEGLQEQRQDSKNFRDTTSSNQSSTNSFQLRRFHSLPFNGDDYEGISQKSMRQNTFKCINQRIQVHFSTLQQIYNAMRTICPDKLPDIDPITKDVNLYSKGKRKTKAYEMRKFFIEEFFTFIFRHPAIMSNPIWFISKLRINEEIWNYSTERNSKMRQYSKENEKKYGYDHCNICKKGKINSMEEFQHYRNYYNSKPDHRGNKQTDKYCFNFFNLIRMRLLSFGYISFNTLERILIFYHFLQGRLDYPFLMHRCNDKSVKIIKVYLPSVDQNFVSVIIDTKSTVGEVLDELGNVFKMKSSLDFDLMATYSGKNRLLDRDQFLLDVIKCLNIEYQQVSADKRQISKTSNKPGFFDSIKKWGKEIFEEAELKNKIIFIKTTYLHRSLQTKSFANNPEKKQLQIEKIYWSIKKGLIKVTDKQFVQLASLFYCLKQLDNIQHFTYLKMSNKPIQKIIPDEHSHIFQYQQQYRKEIGTAIQRQKNNLLKSNKNTTLIHDRIISIVTQKQDYMTYFIEVQPKELPNQLIENKIMPLACLIGVNYKNLIVTRTQHTIIPLVTLPIQDIEWSMSVFSIFISYQNMSFRFDGKMLFHFGQMLRKYQTICKKFPQHLG